MQSVSSASTVIAAGSSSIPAMKSNTPYENPGLRSQLRVEAGSPLLAPRAGLVVMSISMMMDALAGVAQDEIRRAGLLTASDLERHVAAKDWPKVRHAPHSAVELPPSFEQDIACQCRF